ncbi:MAG: hypothetical protein Q8L36_01005 [bacterium]|nr:hypothetical protein [bacterium]
MKRIPWWGWAIIAFVLLSVVLGITSSDEPQITANQVNKDFGAGGKGIMVLIPIIVLLAVLKPILMILGFGKKIVGGGKKVAKWRHDRKFKAGNRVGWSDKIGTITSVAKGKAAIHGDDGRDYRGIKFDDLERI